MTGGPARVLEALRRAGGKPCSGEALADVHGITRAQVWKHVETLRARGYSIAAEAGEGYRFVAAPDRLFAEEIHNGLNTRWLARSIHHFDETDSTNRVALELARSGCPHGTTVIAESQTGGRGRLGRAFYSPAGVNLYTSIVLRPQLATTESATWILAAAAGVADAIASCVDEPDEVEIKWPNDVMLGGRKTCGILMELGAEATQVAFMVLGIGVNLNVDREEFPEEFRDRATSLASHLGRPVDRIEFAQRLYTTLEHDFDICAERGFDGVRPKFDARFRMPGQRVTVQELDGSRRCGTAIGIDADGALLIRNDEGARFRVIAGDVTLAKDSP